MLNPKKISTFNNSKMTNKFTPANYHPICDELAAADTDMQNIITTHGYPPFWSRPNTFETLVHIILEQQVSLASALSAFNKLRERIQELTPRSEERRVG